MFFVRSSKGSKLAKSYQKEMGRKGSIFESCYKRATVQRRNKCEKPKIQTQIVNITNSGPSRLCLLKINSF